MTSNDLSWDWLVRTWIGRGRGQKGPPRTEHGAPMTSSDFFWDWLVLTWIGHRKKAPLTSMDLSLDWLVQTWLGQKKVAPMTGRGKGKPKKEGSTVYA